MGSASFDLPENGGSLTGDPARAGAVVRDTAAACFGAYRLVQAESLLPIRDATIPVDDKSVWHAPAVVDAYVRVVPAPDPTSGDRNLPGFRALSRALADSFELAAGHLPWRAERITAVTRILRSGCDFWSRPQDVELWARDIWYTRRRRAPSNRPGLPHVAHLARHDHGRGQLLEAATASR